MIGVYFKTAKESSLKKIADFHAGSWIHVDQGTIVELNQIKELTGLKIEDLQDSLDKYEAPRLEHKEDKIIIFIRYPSEPERGLQTAPLTIVVTPNYLITISPYKSFLIESLLEQPLKEATQQKSKVLYHILQKTSQTFMAKIKMVRNSVLDIEKQTDIVTSESIIILTKNEDILNQYLSALIPMRNIFTALAAGKQISLFEHDIDLLQDLEISLKQSEDLCNMHLNSIRSLRYSYQILFTNDVNKRMKFLTAITIIVTIPTIIASLYGMNVDLPLSKSPYAFWLILNITLLISVIVYFIFSKKRWL